MSLEKIIEKTKTFVKNNRHLIISGAFITLACIADAYFTNLNIAKYGIDAEGNPLFRSYIENFGTIGLYLPKLGISAAAIGTAFILKKKEHKLKGEYLLYGAGAYFSMGALLNLFYDPVLNLMAQHYINH